MRFFGPFGGVVDQLLWRTLVHLLPESPEDLKKATETLPEGVHFPFQDPMPAALRGLKKEVKAKQHATKPTKELDAGMLSTPDCHAEILRSTECACHLCWVTCETISCAGSSEAACYNTIWPCGGSHCQGFLFDSENQCFASVQVWSRQRAKKKAVRNAAVVVAVARRTGVMASLVGKHSLTVERARMLLHEWLSDGGPIL